MKQLTTAYMVSIYEPYIWRFCRIRTYVISDIVHRKSLRFRTVQLDMDLSTDLIWFQHNTLAPLFFHTLLGQTRCAH